MSGVQDIHVSIVSIQADQSRHLIGIIALVTLKRRFQSYQFRQINPDEAKYKKAYKFFISFNRINSGRSIPTFVPGKASYTKRGVSIVSIQADQSRLHGMTDFGVAVMVFQSYQFRQINPDANNYAQNKLGRYCFNRINSGRSIPTLEIDYVKECIHQSRFNRINSGRSIPT